MSKEYVGLVDNGKETLKCLGCDSELAVVWSTVSDENVDKSIEVYAKCPFCGDYSKKVIHNNGSSIGVPDSGKIEYIDFGDYNGESQELLPIPKES